MSDDRKRYLIKNTLLFTLGNMGSKLITFFLIPLYTNVLTTEQYGTIDLVVTVSTVAVPILTLNICEAVMRFALDQGADHEQITRIGTLLLLIACVAGLAVIPICSVSDRIGPYAVITYFYVLSMAAGQLYLCDLRGKEMLLQYSIGNILLTFLIAVFNILFLLLLRMEITGYLSAYILANLLITIYALIVGKGYRSFRSLKIDRKLLLPMVKYSVVLIPNSFMWWIMNSSDRIMVTAMVGVAANGIYAISYKLPTLVSTLTSIFNQAWSYSAIKEEGAGDEADYNNRVFRYLISIVMMIGIGILTFIKPFLHIYVAPEFYEAWKYTPFLIIGYVYLNMGTFMGTSYTVHKDSFGYLFSAICGAGLNILLNFLLIPKIGVYGAAVATGVSYIAVFGFRLVHTRKYIHYRILHREFLAGTTILFLSSVGIYFEYPLIQGLRYLLFFIALILLGKPWWSMVGKMVRKIRRRG